MKVKGCAVRECSVRLRRCDCGHGPEAGRCSAAPLEPVPSTEVPRAEPCVAEYTEMPVVVVKTECDTEYVLSQEGHTALTYPLDHSKTVIGSVIEQAYKVIMKTEDEADEVRVKQELEVGPTVLTPQSVHRALLFTDERPGPSGVTSVLLPTLLTQPGPSTKAMGDWCKTDPTMFCYTSGVLGMMETDYGTREGHDCICGVRPQSKGDSTADGSRAKITKHMEEKQHHFEHCNYYTASKFNFLIHTHMDKQTSDCGEHGHNSSQLGGVGKDIICQRGEKLQKCQRREHSVSHRGNLKQRVPTRAGQASYCSRERREYRAPRLTRLRKHMDSQAGARPYQYEQSEYSASHLSSLKSHMRNFTREKPYKCEQCEYSASELVNLKRHMRTHTDEKPYQCEQCGYRAPHLSTLKSHMRTHTGEKPYKCEQCEYSASQIGNLTMHIRKHTGERPYQCEQCDYSASLLRHLKNHMRTHTGEKPHKCEQCDYCASELVNLKRHMRTHTGEKPYQCEQCEYSASRLDHLTMHMRTHAGKKPY